MTSTGLDARMRVGRPGGFTLDAEFVIAPGETVALLGPNGAGKSTAVAVIAGLLPLDAGHVTLGGQVLDDPSRDVFVPAELRDVGVVFQDYLLFPHLSVAGNVEFGIRAHSGGRRQHEGRVSTLLGRFDLLDLADRRPGELSGGQQQRVALARALAIGPKALLLDEPLAALDVTTRSRVRAMLREQLRQFPGPRLLITHDPVEAFFFADRIIVLEDGRISQEGRADDIRLRPRTPYVADLAGSNLMVGHAAGGTVDLGGHSLTVAGAPADGDVLVTIAPNAISVHLSRPEGSARNTWPTRIEAVEPLGSRARLLTGSPFPLAVEVTSSAVDALGLGPGKDVWVSIKATEIHVEEAGSDRR